MKALHKFTLFLLLITAYNSMYAMQDASADLFYIESLKAASNTNTDIAPLFDTDMVKIDPDYFQEYVNNITAKPHSKEFYEKLGLYKKDPSWSSNITNFMNTGKINKLLSSGSYNLFCECASNYNIPAIMVLTRHKAFQKYKIMCSCNSSCRAQDHHNQQPIQTFDKSSPDSMTILGFAAGHDDYHLTNHLLKNNCDFDIIDKALELNYLTPRIKDLLKDAQKKLGENNKNLLDLDNAQTNFDVNSHNGIRHRCTSKINNSINKNNL